MRGQGHCEHYIAALLMTLVLSNLPTPVSGITLEKLVMPGPVAQAHEDIESDCKLCHSPGSDRAQRDLCMDCHENVGRDVAEGQGFHGRNPKARAEDCATCHTDHEGRDAQIVLFSRGGFDHEYTDFPLLGAHRTTQCDTCHLPGTAWHSAPGECIDCHADDDHHDGALGPQCADCHGEENWIESRFNHKTTDFPLLGQHQQATCESCHRSANYQATPKTCVVCHKEEDVHNGLNGTECNDCHDAESWVETSFDHLSVSRFALVGGHDNLGCNDCHVGQTLKGLASDCYACHKSDDIHEGKNGRDCGSCHDVFNWTQSTFDHSTTGFRLLGAHDSLVCEECHKKNLSDPIPDTCAGCHQDDPHKAQLGNQCEDCHNNDSWTASVRFDHDLIEFPLLGRHGILECNECHASAAFHDAGDTCIDCHGKDDVHKGGLGSACETCHNPIGWIGTAFDHDNQTAFPLMGSHVQVACESCHRPSDAFGADGIRPCGECHQRDDKHGGRFGEDCGRCHNTRSFRDVKGL